MKTKIYTLITMALVFCAAVTSAKKVHTIGDSTMADYATDGSTDKRGWCQMLQLFFDAEGITVNNRGKSGASSKSFYKESAYWPTLVSGSGKIQEGDFVLIQFAHNDEKSNGTDGDEENAYHTKAGDGKTVDYRGTTPFDTYKQYLRKYIEETKALGGKPILVGAICRKYFSGNSIRRNGRHDLGDSFSKVTENGVTTGNKVGADDHTMDYPYQMKQVAMEYDDVPYIDLTTATEELYLSYGESYCTANLFCSGDNTHPQALGATLIARTFAQLLKKQAEGGETDAKRKAVLEELAQYVVVSNDISFNPASGDFGETYTGMTVSKEFNVSAFGLAATSGKFTFTTTGDFKVSTDKSNWSNELTVDYDNSNLITTIYIQVKVDQTGAVTGTLTASDGTNSKTLDLSVTGKSLAGGEEATCTWPLNAKSGSATSELLTAADVTVSGMTDIKGTVTPTAPEGHGAMAYFDIEGSSWPAGEIDEVSTRYIQFQATVPADKQFDMDKISFDVCGWGGNTVSYHAYYATKADFSDQVLIGEGVKMTAKTANTISKDIVATLEEGQSIYIRIYPWLNNLSSAATGKYIALSDVTIHGMLSNVGGVDITGSITYSLADGNLNTDPVMDPESLGVGFVAKNWTAGNSLTVGGTTTYSSATENTNMLKIYNDTGVSFPSSATDDNTLTLTLTPDDGYYFMPSQVSFAGARFGTDGGTLTVTAAVGEKIETLCTAANVNRSGKKLDIAKFSYTLSSLVASYNEPLTLNFSFIGLGKTKTMGLANLVIEGKLTGSASTSTKYELTTGVTPAEAGTITKEPDMASYKEGTEVTLTASKNFGYKFKEWQDATGAMVSTDAQVTVTMDAEKNMQAVFEEVPVYTLATKVTNDADRSLGSITLSPNEHNGKYEAGTVVTATAEESKILKFMQWTDANENAGTTATRQITVNSDMEIVANYEVQDFIAVYDASKVNTYAYDTTEGYPFSADLTWDEQRNATAAIVKVSDGALLYTQNGGTPVVRNRNGVVISDINGLYQNGYNTAEIAWQYDFSTKGFTDITFVGDMAAKNGASTQWKAQMSVDGTNYTDISGATWTATANVVNPINITLPETANGQEKVSLRITGVGTEVFNNGYTFDNEFNGMKYTSHSESGVGNVYVLGVAEVEDDAEAPVVTAMIPANQATGVSATGKITISFNERIKAVEGAGNATLNGKELTAQWSSRSVSFDYFNLTYGEQYTFNMPAGFVQDNSGNKAAAVALTFTVMERQQPAARTFDAIVDGSLEADVAATDDMPAQYKKIQDAINAAPSNSTTPYLIYIKEGYYNDPNETFNSSYGFVYKNPSDASSTETTQIEGGKSQYDECRLVYVNKPNIHIIGQAVDKVTIAGDRLDGGASWDRSRAWYHVNAGATLEIQEGADGFYMENITVDNENWTVARKEGPQALSINTNADRLVFNNMNVRSYQDTYKANGTYNRAYWHNSTIEGSVDFIYGDCDIWFENTVLNINRKDGGYIVAPSHPADTRWGYVFNNTTITSSYFTPEEGRIWLGRPWHNNPKTVFLHTQMELGAYDGYWYETMGGLPALWAVYDIWDKNGNKMSEISREDYWCWNSDKTEKITAKAKNALTAEEVATYTVQNVMAGDGTSNASTGVWNPLPIVEKTDAPVLTVSGSEVSWEAVPYAICYVVTVNGKAVAFPTATTISGLNKDDVVSVQAVSENGALSMASSPVTIGETTAISAVNNNSKQATEIYTLDGKRIQNMQRGMNIIRMNDGTVRKVVR